MSAATTLDFSTPHVLRNKREFEAAVKEIDQLLDLDPKKRSPEYERLEFLSVLVEAYEEKNVEVPDATPQEVVDFMLDQHELTRADLHEAFGGRSRVSDFFNGKRALSKSQAVALRELLGIPLDALLP